MKLFENLVIGNYPWKWQAKILEVGIVSRLGITGWRVRRNFDGGQGGRRGLYLCRKISLSDKPS